jgi:hypothetical protein
MYPTPNKKFEDKQLLLRDMVGCRLPLDCLKIVILGINLERCDKTNWNGKMHKYRILLGLPCFARSTLNPTANKWWRIRFTIHYQHPIGKGLYLCWKLNGMTHMEETDENGEQLPAQYQHGSTYWYMYGYLHRTDGGPSIVTHNQMSWYKHGLEHRDERDSLGRLLPSTILCNPHQEFFALHGRRYRLQWTETRL